MIRFIVGPKGSGKTKRMIEMANEAVKTGKGDVVFIDGDNRHITKLNHRVRYISTGDFEVKNLKVFFGFLCGIIAENYDVDQIYIDGLKEIAKEGTEDIEDFVSDIKNLSDKFNIRFVISFTGDPESVPDFMKEYVM